MSKSKSSPAPAAPAAPTADQTLANMMSVSNMGNPEAVADPAQQNQSDFAKLFPALAQLQEFRGTFRNDMKQQALGGLMKMFGGGG